MSKRKQSSLLGNFRFTSEKLNQDSGGGSAANNVNAGPSSANASTCPMPGHFVSLQARLLVRETATGVECYPWLETNFSEKGPGVHLAAKWINGDSDSNKFQKKIYKHGDSQAHNSSVEVTELKEKGTLPNSFIDIEAELLKTTIN